MAELGAGNGTEYPTTIDTNNTLEVDSPSAAKTKARADVPNDHAAALVAIETELGTDPAGSATDLKTRLAVSMKDSGAMKNSIAKNFIINGALDIWQRGTSFAGVSNNDYTVDRFSWVQVGAGVVDHLRETTVPTQAESNYQSNYDLQVDVTTADASIAAGDLYALIYKMEGYDFKELEGRTATLSFWVKSTVKTGIHCVSFQNSVANQSYPVEYTINAADTWEKKTITVTFDSGGAFLYTNGTGLHLYWAIAVGTDFHGTADTWNAANNISTVNQVNGMDSTSNNFFLAQVQLELGSAASDFSTAGRNFQDELAMCQRYVWVPTTANAELLVGYATTTTIARYVLKYPVTMRTAPTLTASAGTALFMYYAAAFATSSAVAGSNIGVGSMRVQATTGSAVLTVGEGMTAGMNGSSTLVVNAEL